MCLCYCWVVVRSNRLICKRIPIEQSWEKWVAAIIAVAQITGTVPLQLIASWKPEAHMVNVNKRAAGAGGGGGGVGGGNQKAGGSLTVTYMFPLCTRRHFGGSDPSRVAARLLCWKNTGCFSWYPSPDFETTCICVDFQHNVILITQQLTCIVTRSGWYWASLYVSLSLLTTRDVMGLGLGLVMI